MNKIHLLEEKVRSLYEAKNPHRADWADWLYENHVFVVARNAQKIAERYGAKPELAMAAAILHDVADSEMSRFATEHKERSLEMARQLLEEAGFSEEEKEVIMDAILYHSCHSNEAPHFLEGKVMATADAIAHLSTDFYDQFSSRIIGDDRAPEGMPIWVLEKIERDFTKKIFFDEVREEVRTDYERVKQLFVS